MQQSRLGSRVIIPPKVQRLMASYVRRRSTHEHRPMLWTPECSFNWQLDNLGTTFTDAGLGTQIAAATSANTKNSSISTILTGLTYDCYGLAVGLFAGSSSGNSRRFLTDIYVDPNGLGSWDSAPIIANLGSNNSTLTMGGTWYYFPIFIKNSGNVGATCQSETLSATQRIVVIAYGQPSRPEVYPVGQFVRTFGATTASTTGTAVTPGSSGALGSYTALSASDMTDDLWWWQMSMLINDTTQTAVGYWCDLGVGASGSQSLVIQGAQHLNVGTVEAAGFPNCGGIGKPPQLLVKAGTGIKPFARIACTGTPDSNVSAIAYGVGG